VGHGKVVDPPARVSSDLPLGSADPLGIGDPCDWSVDPAEKKNEKKNNNYQYYYYYYYYYYYR